MIEQEKIDDIVAMLDNFVSNGGGHMNIQVTDPNEIEEVQVNTYQSIDCSVGNIACSVPTLHRGMDEEER